MSEVDGAVKEEFLKAAKLLADGIDRRVDVIENRLDRVEDARENEVSRVIQAVDRLGRLEAIPGRMDTLEQTIRHRDIVVDGKFKEVTDRLDVLEDRGLIHEAKEAGKKETVQHAVNIGGWIAKNFWPIIATAAVGGTALKEIPWPTVTIGPHVPENAKIVTIKGRIE